MTTITITYDQNLTLLYKSLENGFISSYVYVKEVFNGVKHNLYDEEDDGYAITFDNDTDATWFLLNL
jgi:hypothetical protein